MLRIKSKITHKIQPGCYFYFFDCQEPKDWYKVVAVNYKEDNFTITWTCGHDNDRLADPLTTRLSSYIDEIMTGTMIICSLEDEERAPEILKAFQCSSLKEPH